MPSWTSWLTHVLAQVIEENEEDGRLEGGGGMHVGSHMMEETWGNLLKPISGMSKADHKYE